MTVVNNNRPKPHRATVKDVANHYSVHENTVYNWLKRDDPPPHRKAGGQYRFNLDEVDDWMESRHSAP